MLEVVGAVVDQHVSPEHMLVPEQYSIPPMDKREIFIQPLVFLNQGIGELHGRRGNIHLILVRKFTEDFLAVLNWLKLPEKPGFIIMLPDALPMFGYLLPNLPAHALFFAERGPMTLIVPFDMSPIGVGNHFVHVDKYGHSPFSAKY
jgi:hypothetical protein